jgi:hypothetical protein
MAKMPTWKVPRNLGKALGEGEGTWEDERWSPILLTAMSGTELDGRDIDVAWQIEFDPFDDDLEAANTRLEESGMEPDGYGWGEHVRKVIRKSDPALAKRLHMNDCETDTCVIWVESEHDARAVLETVWKLIHEGG